MSHRHHPYRHDHRSSDEDYERHRSERRRDDNDGYIQTVEFRTTSDRRVAVCVGKITKVVLLNRTRRGYLYAIHTADGGSRTVVLSPYGWEEFNDYLFDPDRVRRKHGSDAIRRDCHLDLGEEISDAVEAGGRVLEEGEIVVDDI